MKWNLALMLVLALTACGNRAPPTPTPSPTHTPEPTIAPTSTSLAAASSPIAAAQVISGTIRLDQDRTALSSGVPLPDVSLVNFVVTARFYNPYAASGSDTWNYGFAGRVDLTNLCLHHVVLNSDGTWAHRLLMNGKEELRDEGRCGNGVALDAGQSNELRLVVVGDQGQFWINGQLAATLDTSGLGEPGNVLPYGFVSVADKTIRFEDLLVWSLD